MSESWTPPTANDAMIANNLVLAIIATIVSIIGCCLPHGVVSLIFATQVNKKVAAGDIAAATNAAKQARMWAWISIAVGVIGLITWIIVCSIFGVAAIWGS